MRYDYSDIILKDVKEPEHDCTGIPVQLTDETMHQRKAAVLKKMEELGLDTLVIYADMEHGSNFEYLVGFLPRFEEALLVLHSSAKAYLVLGNENLNKAGKSRIEAEAVLASCFSLPDQPMLNDEPFAAVIAKTGIRGKTGIAGWKNFSGKYDDRRKMFDIPAYILDAVRIYSDDVINACDLFIGADGVRTVCSPNEIARYEFAASLASDCMLDAMDVLKPGISEMEAADRLVRFGQRTSVVTIAAFGERFIKANMYPTDRKLKKADPVSLTIGYRGGLSSRAGIAVSGPQELPEGCRDYFEKVCAPYFTAVRAWLEQVHTGMTGGEVYALIDEVLPKREYGWKLNPGHTTAEEEWMSSPVYEGSDEVIRSGSLFQTDIIPSVKGYPGVSAESTCLLADEALRKQIEKEYPDMYARMMKRRAYLADVLGIRVNEDILPMCSTLGYMRPLMLSEKAAAVAK
ncbi:MAG: M24 family metallopeptidase [Solobacterium sp.]|nr:M24 family metallopeptidase [Solobacterium sp.]